MGQDSLSKIVLFVLTKAAIIQSIMSSLCIESIFQFVGLILYTHGTLVYCKHVIYFRFADKLLIFLKTTLILTQMHRTQ